MALARSRKTEESGRGQSQFIAILFLCSLHVTQTKLQRLSHLIMPAPAQSSKAFNQKNHHQTRNKSTSAHKGTRPP